ncbi:unnamed protein product, partial [Meganyctiphanes norvegica]
MFIIYKILFFSSQTDGSASFLRAARAGNLEKVLEFLKTNTDINTCNANGLNALHLASKEGHINVVKELINRGANVDSATKKGNTALHIASLAGQEEIVKVLVQNSALVNTQSQNGFTPLYMAAQENHDTVVRYLLGNNANQSLATEDGFTPLAVALQQGHDKVVAVLLENDTRGKVRLPALHIAAKKDDTKAAALLLHTDHNPDVTSKSGFTPLHIAAHYGNENIANLLIQRGADVNYIAKHQITPLHVASKWGKGNMVSLLIDKGANLEAKTRDGLTPLHCAARSGHETVVDMLLEKGAPITSKTKNGLAPLHMASQGDHVDAARILLYHKAPVDDVTVDFLTALHVAAHCGHVKVAKLLLDRKGDANSRALNGFTPLHIACKKNRIKVVELLLKHGASIEATTESGLTPLHVASFMGCMNIVIYLIQHGASADVPTVRGETPLHLAARANQTDIIRILLRNGAQVDARAREQQTALHIASRLGNSDIVVLLLQHGAAVDATTKDHYTALHIAAKEGQEEVASVLLEHNASLTATTKKGFTPLHLAAKYGNMKVARLLLQKDAPVDAQGKNGVTPLHVAAHYDHQNVALLLLDKGASPHATAKNGYTPLHIAARKNQMDIATTLLEYGASANAESKAGFSPLHLSAQEGHTDMSTLLIEHGAAPDVSAKNGLSPLHLCAQEDRVSVAAILVKHGAGIDPATKAGYTPLHVASHFGQMNMVRFLLQHGAKVHSDTTHGYTPLHQAAQQGHTQVVNVLLENKAEPNAETKDGKTALSIAQRLGYISVVETLKIVTETTITTTTTTVTEDKYKVVVPETMHETFMSESEDEGGDDTMLGDQSYRYLTVDEMKSLGDDSMPMDTTKDEKMDVSFISNLSAAPPQAPVDQLSPQHQKEQQQYTFTGNFAPDNVDICKTPILAGYKSFQSLGSVNRSSVYSFLSLDDLDGQAIPDNQWPFLKRFLVSFMVDARGGAMRGCRHSGVRVIIPPRKAGAPMRITCRYLKKDKLVHAPPLMEGEALGSRILEMGPSGAKFLGPVIIEVPHFASLRGKEREIVILRSDNGETWREHTLEATEEAVQEVLNESFDGEDLKQLEDLNTNRITRILTTDFPQYFAIVTRIRQEVHAIGPEGGMVSSTVVPQVQAVFPQGALTKKIKVGLQAQPIQSDLVAKLLGNRVAVSPIVTVEPRRRKFHKPITLTIPVPQAASKGMINQYSGEAPTLRLLCSITGGTTRAQWEDVTGSTPLTFVNDCVSFTTTVSARFWLMDCSNIPEATKMATELYREAIHVPFQAKFVVFSKRHQLEEARVRVFCMTDDREDKTLETQEHFVEVTKSRDVEVLEGKPQYLEFAGNVVPVTKSGDQLAFNFYAFRENRLPFTVRVKDQHSDPAGRIAFMRQPKVGRGDPPQTPICNLNIALPDNIQPEPAPSEPDLLALEKKYSFLSISKADTIHKADLRLSDISNMLGNDWVGLAHELDISDSDINLIKSQYPDNVSQQAIVMLRLWMQTSGTNKSATGNALEKGLRKISREDIVNQCIFNVELVTDDIEKAMAKAHLDQSGFDAFRDELGPSRDATFIRDVSLDVSYDEQDLMKEAESAEEEEENHKAYPDKSTREQHRVADLSPTYETEEKKYAGEEKIVKENIIMEEKVNSKEEKKKNEESNILDEYSMMEEYLSKSESVPVIKESKVDKVVEEKPSLKDDEMIQMKYVQENKIEVPVTNESKVDKVLEEKLSLKDDEMIQMKYVQENKIEESKVEKIEKAQVDTQNEKKIEEYKSEKRNEDKHDLQEQELTIKDVQQEEHSKLSATTQEPVIDTQKLAETKLAENITAETVSSSVDGIDSTTTKTERREIITGEDGSIQERVVVEKVTKQEVTVPSEDVQMFEVAKEPLVYGQLQDQSGTTISERTEINTNEDGSIERTVITTKEDGSIEKHVFIEQSTTNKSDKPSVEARLLTETISSSIPDKSSSTTERRSFTTSDDGSGVEEHIIIEKRTTTVIDEKETQEDKSEMLQKLGEELGRLDEKLEEKFKEKRTREEPEVLGGLSAVQEETLVAKRRSQVNPNKPESSQVVVDQLQTSPDGQTTITTNIIKTTTSTSYTPDRFTQTSVESSQMSSERGTAEVTSAGDTEQGEQQTTMLMGQGTHESTSQSQQVEEQPSALSRDQDVGVVFTERKEYGGGVKQPAAETTGQHSHIAPSPTSHPTQQTTPSQPLSPLIKEETSSVSRPTRRHERNLSQATNIFMGVMPAEGKPDAKAEIQKAIQEEAPIADNVGPYNERRQFWETKTLQSFESKGSDTDTGKTEETVVETKKDSMITTDSEDEYISQRDDPVSYENEAFEGTDKIDVPSQAGNERCTSPFEVVRSLQSETPELPSPEDVAFKDVSTKREIFEKEIKRQSMELEESQSWKRSSKEYDDKVIVTEESQSHMHEENRSKHDKEQKIHEVLKEDKSIIKEKTEIEKKSKEENKTKEDTKITSSETVTELEKKLFKKSDEIITSHEKIENIESSKLKSDEIVKQNKEVTHTELSSANHKEFKEEKLIREEKKEIKTDSHSKVDIKKTEEKFESKSKSSSKAKEVFQTDSLESNTTSQEEIIEDDITRLEETSDEEQDEVQIKQEPIVEQKVTEETRVMGDSHETTVRETTTTRKGDAEERVIKETKTLETFMADGSTVKSTSITTFTTQLDKTDSEELSDDSIPKEEKYSIESLKDSSLEIKPISQPLTSPIKVPEEKVQDVVWEVSQERSDEVVSETVQDIPSHEHITHHSVKDVSNKSEDVVKKVQLSEEEARKLAIEIVEEVKTEAIKRSPLVTPSQSMKGFKDIDLPTPGPKSAFTIETSSKIEKYIQEKLSEEVDENALRLIESVTAKKSEILQKKLQGKQFQISVDITDEDLRCSAAELSPVEHHMERLRQMTEDENFRYPREPSEADESEGSMIINETLEDDDVSYEYNQATQMINKTLDAVKASDLTNSGQKTETRSKIGIITEEKVPEQINLSNSEVTETARQIVKEITEKAQESEAVKLASLDTIEQREQRGSSSHEHSRTPSPHSSRKGSWMDDEELRREFRRDYEDKKKMFKLTSDKEDNVFDDEVVIKTSEIKEVLKESTKDYHDITISHQKSEESHSQIHMESSMTESMEESSAAESSRYFEGKMRSEITVIKEGKESETDRRSSSSCEEVIMRKKYHTDEFKRKSGTDFDANSTSSSSEKGESPYFTAGEGTSDSRSVSRPCSSDVEALISGTTGTSEYETACTSQDTSQRSNTSQEYQTAASSLSSRDSMKSVDSESSGNLGSIELSETSETLVPSAMELERDMDLLDQEEFLEEERIIAGHSHQKVIPQLTIQSETPVSEDSPSPFGIESEGEADSDSKDDDIRTTSKMKRSIEMTFHPEPTPLRESTKTVPVSVPSGSKNDSVASSLEESTVSEVSVKTVLEKSQGESSDTNMTISSVSEQLASSIEYLEESDQQIYRTDSSVLTTESGSSGVPHSVTITATSVQTTNNQKTATMCTQVTSETHRDIEEIEKYESEQKQFFRANGPTEVDYVPEYDDASVQRNSQWPVEAPAVPPTTSGVSTGPSEGPQKVTSTEESCETEADQEYGQMIREGDISELAEAELQYTLDDQPEADMSSMLVVDEPIERPKTPEPGYVPPPTLHTQVTVDSADEPEEFTEVDKRFSAVFSMTYEEREEGARSLGYSSMSVDIPDITISEHTTPMPDQYCYPDLEREEDFPECRALAEAQEKSNNDIPGTPGSQESASTGASRKSSTTDSEQGQEYCLDDVMKSQDYSDYGSFEIVGADDILDSSEYERTLNMHEERMMQMTLIKEEEEEEEIGKNKNNTSPVQMPSQLKAVRIEKKEPPEALVIDDEEFVAADETIEEKKRWLELLFEEELIAEESRKAAYDYHQQSLVEHVYSGPLEDIEEEREDVEKRDHSQVAKPSSLSSTPEYDVLAGRKFFTRSGEHDDVSINSLQSLQDFENLEKEVAVDGIPRRTSSGSQESLNGKKYESKSGQGDDISIGSFSSLSEFEKLEEECVIVEEIEKKAKIEEAMLSEIEEGHESQVSESESCETLSDAGQGSADGDDYEERMFEIDEIIRQAQSNVEGFNKKNKTHYDGVRLSDIVGSGSADATESSLIDRTTSFGRDSLEEAQVPELEFDASSSKTKGISVKVSKNSDIMTISSDSIEEPKSMVREQSQDSLEKLIAPLTGSAENMTTSVDSIEFTSKQDPMTISTDSLDDRKRKVDPMSISTDSIDPARRDMMTTSVDSLGRDDSSGRDADISSGSEQIGRRIGPDGIMECSIDSLGGISFGDPTSSQATNATYQYDTDSMMSSFTSGCSNTLVATGEETSDIMTSSMYLPEGELPSDTNQRHMQYIQTGAGAVVETVTDSNEPGFSRTIHRMVELPPEAHQVTFTGPNAQRKLTDYMERFNAGEDSIEEERVDEHGNVHTRRVVQKRILVDPAEATHFGISSSDPNVQETEEIDKHGNVTRIVKRTVVTTETVEVDLDTGEPILKPTQTVDSSFTSSYQSSPSRNSRIPRPTSHVAAPTSHVAVPQPPPGLPLEPNTVSGVADEDRSNIHSYSSDESENVTTTQTRIIKRPEIDGENAYEEY